jgi:iron complex transport system substrate-binding protein
MTQRYFFTIIVIASLCAACGGHGAVDGISCNYYQPRHARGFCIDTINGAKVLRVVNPFQGNGRQQYNYTLTAMRHVICMSTTHIGMLAHLGRTDAVIGVSAAKYIYNPALRAAYSAGMLSEVGYDSNLDIEKILRLQPAVVLAYGINNEFEQTARKLAEVGVATIYIGEYVEEHPLGKAEWAVAIGAIVGSEDTAMALFANVEREYAALAKLIPDDASRIPCLLNAPWNDAWFMPCQHSNMAQYLRDAGGASVMPLRAQCEAFPESIENVYAHSHAAQCWLNAGNAANIAALAQMHKLISAMPVLHSGRVYTHNKRCTQQGGSDFFESAAACPHLVLKDLIAILHPQALPQHELYYYQRLE